MFNKQAYKFYEAVTEKITPIYEEIKCHELSNLKLLGYNKVFDDCSYIYVGNKLDEYFKTHCNILKDPGIHFIKAIQKTSSNKPYTMIWPQVEDNSVLSLLRKYDIGYGVSVLYRVNDGVETISLAGDKNNYTFQSSIMNNLECFNAFLAYFKRQVIPIIKNCHKKDRGIYINKFDINFKHHDSREYLFTDLEGFNRSNALHICTKNQSIKLSARETQCITLISKGLTIKRIGTILNLSPRTIETYINNIKIKVNVNSKDALIELYYSAKNKVIKS